MITSNKKDGKSLIGTAVEVPITIYTIAHKLTQNLMKLEVLLKL